MLESEDNPKRRRCDEVHDPEIFNPACPRLLRREVTMANTKVREMFIEQEIAEGLKEGKTAYAIGKELSTWMEKLFNAKIPARTIEQRVRRIKEKDATFVASDSTTESESKLEVRPHRLPMKVVYQEGCFYDHGLCTPQEIGLRGNSLVIVGNMPRPSKKPSESTPQKPSTKASPENTNRAKEKSDAKRRRQAKKEKADG